MIEKVNILLNSLAALANFIAAMMVYFEDGMSSTFYFHIAIAVVFGVCCKRFYKVWRETREEDW